VLRSRHRGSDDWEYDKSDDREHGDYTFNRLGSRSIAWRRCCQSCIRRWGYARFNWPMRMYVPFWAQVCAYSSDTSAHPFRTGHTIDAPIDCDTKRVREQ